MSRTLQVVLVALMAIVFGLSALARRYPDVAWLQPFKAAWPRLAEEQKAVQRRRANAHAGVQLILLGFVIPLAYGVLTVMFFNSFTAGITTLVLLGALLCVALGVVAIVRSRRA
jgi:hypothetical protein